MVGSQYLIHYSGVTPISAYSLLYALYLVKILFDVLGKKLPFKELILSLMGLQLLISPYLEYYYFHNEIFGVMRVDEVTYFSYTLPATVSLHVGLNLFYPNRTYVKECFQLIRRKLKSASKIGFYLIIVGYIFYLLSGFAPGSLNFVVVTLAFMRFIGFFYVWLGGSKFTRLAFYLVFIPFIWSIVKSTIFIDLIIFSILITTVYVMQNKIPRWKIIAFSLAGIFSIFILQSVKYSYRKAVWTNDFQGDRLNLLTDLMLKQVLNLNDLDIKAVGSNVNIRLNQGWILTGIMENIPANKPIANGSYIEKEVLGLLLPRFLYPEKPTVGDRNKFEQFVGWRLGQGVSMNVGIMGDGYGNFGPRGGILFCFFFGSALGLIFKLFYHLAKTYPTLPIWGILIFFYSMRAGNEFYIIMNWIIKTSLFVFIYYFIFEKSSKVNQFMVNRFNTSLRYG
ncbi:MAG: hypothetical protein F6K19_22665 [Cyanothece sp. SIO1E1]|nr:hypothetical protein [Cyanothece sp. SIO1E1]